MLAESFVFSAAYFGDKPPDFIGGLLFTFLDLPCLGFEFPPFLAEKSEFAEAITFGLCLEAILTRLLDFQGNQFLFRVKATFEGFEFLHLCRLDFPLFLREFQFFVCVSPETACFSVFMTFITPPCVILRKCHFKLR